MIDGFDFAEHFDQSDFLQALRQELEARNLLHVLQAMQDESCYTSGRFGRSKLVKAQLGRLLGLNPVQLQRKLNQIKEIAIELINA